MNIWQAYEIYQEIKNAPAPKSYEVKVFSAKYNLDTPRYTICARKKDYYVPRENVALGYTEKVPQTKYEISASNKTSGKQMYDDGILAQILFYQIQNKTKAK